MYGFNFIYIRWPCLDEVRENNMELFQIVFYLLILLFWFGFFYPKKISLWRYGVSISLIVIITLFAFIIFTVIIIIHILQLIVELNLFHFIHLTYFFVLLNFNFSSIRISVLWYILASFALQCHQFHIVYEHFSCVSLTYFDFSLNDFQFKIAMKFEVSLLDKMPKCKIVIIWRMDNGELMKQSWEK